uniref:growth-regulating factor 6 isoform X2 n=1 Tax=Erigeron canadensis TaxID=72917 RepID=UPI001CB92602|nr:growth-regulating factor 6 isoform X2 [Erigeron canadensis]
MMSRASGRYHPFTASQWQELEHQALVYKYMISGIPIPPHLLFTINSKTTPTDSSSTKLLLPPPHPSSIGWNCFHPMGYGRKIDPEPGRCRRTDGKKWRCSKEAYPDSKYCERHMHRGRNRSRKPVEPPKTAPSSDYYHTTDLLSSSRPSHVVLSSSQQHHFLLESTPTYRKTYGIKDQEIDEHPFFSQSPSGTINKTSSSGLGDSWQAMNNSSSKHTPFSDFHQNNTPGYLYTTTITNQHQSYYDQLALKLDRKDEPQHKVMHHFFDEWPPNDDKDSSTTQLSISIPASSAHDFFLTHNDK